MKDKQTLRRTLLERLRRQPEHSRIQKSGRIERRLVRLAAYRRAKAVFCYVSVGSEVNTRSILGRILRDGKTLTVPMALGGGRMKALRIHQANRDLRRTGLFGIPVPSRSSHRRISLKTLDLVIVPGVAFDAAGHRLGRGGGYFDRFLSRIPARVPRVGLAFEFQKVRKVPKHPHDEPVHWLITEKKTYENSDRR